MKNQKLEAVLEQIAWENHVAKQQVRLQMQRAMDEAMASTDPVVQARWAAVPRKGEKVTLEEFIAYLASMLPKDYQ